MRWKICRKFAKKIELYIIKYIFCIYYYWNFYTKQAIILSITYFSMTDIIKIVQQSFEDIKITDESGFEFWSARDLMNTLWYVKWQKFDWIIQKAKDSCKNSWQIIEDNFLSQDEFLPAPVKTSMKWWRPIIRDELRSQQNLQLSKIKKLKRFIICL